MILFAKSLLPAVAILQILYVINAYTDPNRVEYMAK